MLSKTAEYALRATVWMAQNEGQSGSADRIAEATQVPRRYLHKVVQDLVKAGIARSQPGPRGGYSLAKDANEISILDVVNAVSPVERIKQCPLGLPSHTELCPLHRELDRVYESTENALKRVTLGQVVRSSNPIFPLRDYLKTSPPPE